MDLGMGKLKRVSSRSAIANCVEQGFSASADVSPTGLAGSVTPLNQLGVY
jgi:hypothetical protein